MFSTRNVKTISLCFLQAMCDVYSVLCVLHELEGARVWLKDAGVLPKGVGRWPQGAGLWANVY